MSDAETLAFYAANAGDYVAATDTPSMPHLARFLGALTPGDRILELGTGSGADAAFMIAQGFDVEPSDASAALAAKASLRLGRSVRRLSFHELDEIARYDGVWASACLLHAPRTELTADLTRIHQALKPNGLLVASFKAGDGEGRDQFGRYYNYVSKSELFGFVTASAAWVRVEIDETQGTGYDGLPTHWLWLRARKSS